MIVSNLHTTAWKHPGGHTLHSLAAACMVSAWRLKGCYQLGQAGLVEDGELGGQQHDGGRRISVAGGPAANIIAALRIAHLLVQLRGKEQLDETEALQQACYGARLATASMHPATNILRLL